MIRIEFIPPTDDEWLSWCEECETARGAAIAHARQGLKPTISDLYKDDRMKRIYKADDGPFHGKCAYCESKVKENQPGDIEHFRPKGRIQDGDRKPVMIQRDDGSMVQHLGYYWLAYNWKNLLLACADCNRPRTNEESGQSYGKWDQFPVKGNHATSPGEEENESPLLVNPVHEDPSKHLTVDSTGTIFSCDSPRGRECIAIFGLNIRVALVEARRREYKRVEDLALFLVFSRLRDDDCEVVERNEECERVRGGATPFAMAGRLALDTIWDRVGRIGETAINPAEEGEQG